MKRWENGLEKWDLTEETRKANDFLSDYGHDQYTYDPEAKAIYNLYLKNSEAANAHGYPATSWL